MQVYDDPANTTTTVFRPDSAAGGHDPHRSTRNAGRLNGIAVQLLTLGVDRTGELREVPHAEWSVRTVWN